MPRSGAQRTICLTRSAPSRCPTSRRQPRLAAPRPLPSMMMATCSAGRGLFGSDLSPRPTPHPLPDVLTAAGTRKIFCENFSPAARASNLHDFGLFMLQRPIHGGNRLVGQLLHFVRPHLLVILAHAGGFGLFDLVHAIAAHVAD